MSWNVKLGFGISTHLIPLSSNAPTSIQQNPPAVGGQLDQGLLIMRVQFTPGLSFSGDLSWFPLRFTRFDRFR